MAVKTELYHIEPLRDNVTKSVSPRAVIPCNPIFTLDGHHSWSWTNPISSFLRPSTETEPELVVQVMCVYVCVCVCVCGMGNST